MNSLPIIRFLVTCVTCEPNRRLRNDFIDSFSLLLSFSNLSFLRWCPYGQTSIQVSKFPRVHNQLVRDLTSISELVGLVFRGLGN
jgi:hypothetical protein